MNDEETIRLVLERRVGSMTDQAAARNALLDRYSAACEAALSLQSHSTIVSLRLAQLLILDAHFFGWIYQASAGAAETLRETRGRTARVAEAARKLAEAIASCPEGVQRLLAFHAWEVATAPTASTLLDAPHGPERAKCLDEGLNKFAESIEAVVDGWSQQGRPRDYGRDHFVSQLGMIWHFASGKEASASWNTSTNYRHPFYRFVELAWHPAGMGPVPAIETIHNILKRSVKSRSNYLDFIRTVEAFEHA